MSAALAAALLLLSWAAAAVGEDETACLSAYQEGYASAWSLDKDAWAFDCRRGFKGDEILRRHQARFVEACRKRFAEQARKAGENESTLIAYCARGAAGEAFLAGRGAAAQPPAPAAEPANAWQRIYALTRWKGNRGYAFSRVGSTVEVRHFDFRTVDVRVPSPPTETVDRAYRERDICTVSTRWCPDKRCDGIPGFDETGFSLEFDDVGCKGTLESIRWVPQQDRRSAENQAKTRAWLDAARFERVGRAYEAWLRGVYQLK